MKSILVLQLPSECGCQREAPESNCVQHFRGVVGSEIRKNCRIFGFPLQIPRLSLTAGKHRLRKKSVFLSKPKRNGRPFCNKSTSKNEASANYTKNRRIQWPKAAAAPLHGIPTVNLPDNNGGLHFSTAIFGALRTAFRLHLNILNFIPLQTLLNQKLKEFLNEWHILSLAVLGATHKTSDQFYAWLVSRFL